jgi:cytochrome P450
MIFLAKSPVFRPLVDRLLGHGLVWAEGEEHKQQRKLLNPAFR